MSDNIITGIYPGTFDPVTYGHLDIIFRATHIVNKLVISVAENINKKPLFNLIDKLPDVPWFIPLDSISKQVFIICLLNSNLDDANFTIKFLSLYLNI